MAQRPKRSIPRGDYASLANVKLPRSKRTNNCDMPRDSKGEANRKLYRLEIVDKNMETSQVKVIYVGYSTDFDEWRAREDISNSDSEDDLMEFPSGSIQQFCLL